MATAVPPKPSAIFNLPNQLTFGRLGLAVVLFVLIAWEQWLGCLVTFALAALTDYLDGYIARIQGLQTSLGRVLDPLVDKVLTCGAFIYLLSVEPLRDLLAPWMVVVLVSREFLITGLRSYLESLGARFGADWGGKVKMALQCAALVGIFLYLHQPEPWLQKCVFVLIWSMVIATVGSGLQYIWRGVIILSEAKL